MRIVSPKFDRRGTMTGLKRMSGRLAQPMPDLSHAFAQGHINVNSVRVPNPNK